MIFLKEAIGNTVTITSKFSIFSVLLLLLSGCAVNVKMLSEVQDTVQEAQDLLRAVEELELEAKYTNLYAEAQKELKQSEKLMQARTLIFKNKVLKARLAAENSKNASQKILKQYYFDELMPKTNKLIKEIEEKIGPDTDSPLNEHLPELQTILDYGKDLDNEKIKALINKVVGSANTIKKKESIKKSFASEELKTDVSFKLGKYNLSEDGKKLLNKKLIKKIITDKDQYKKLHQNSTIIIKIEVKGFTDRVRFNERTRLFRKLKKDVENMLPPRNQPAKRRKFLNQRLSKLRAESIAYYIAQQISETETGNTGIKIIKKPVGMGEAIPGDVTPLKSINDPRRRICKIYCYVSYLSQQ